MPQSCNSSRELSFVLAQIFTGDCSSLDLNGSILKVEEETTKAIFEQTKEKEPKIGMLALRDSILLKKKKKPSEIFTAELKMEHTKKNDAVRADEIDKDRLLKHRKLEINKGVETITKKRSESKKYQLNNNCNFNIGKDGSNITKKQEEGRIIQKKVHQKSSNNPIITRPSLPSAIVQEDSVGKLKKSYQNLNINININFNEKKKENMLKKAEAKNSIEEAHKKDYPKLNLFNLISKNKKLHEEPSIPNPVKSSYVDNKTLLSSEFGKVFQKKFSEPTNGQKVLFAKKSSEVNLIGSGCDSKEAILQDLEPEYKDSLFLKKKHSMSSSVNSIQNFISTSQKNKLLNFNSSGRAETSAKKNIDIFEKKRKNSNLSNLHNVKSKKDLRSSMKSQKITSHRYQNSATKLEPKSSRNNNPINRTASKKSMKKLFMSQDFKQGGKVLGVNLFDFKTHAQNVSKHNLKGSIINQVNLLTNSHSTKMALFGPKRSLAPQTKDILNDAIGNSTYRSKRSSSKNLLNGGNSDQDLLGRKKKIDTGFLKFSAFNLHQSKETSSNQPKNKKSIEKITSNKHQRVRSDLKTNNKPK